MIEKIKKELINEIIKIEGGYVDDPTDSGGETNFGITKNVAHKFGFTKSMKNLTKEIAFEIYEKGYWDRLFLNDICKLDDKIARNLFDTGVNMGIYAAGDFLQRSLNALNYKEKYFENLKKDGVLGKATLAALQTFLKHKQLKGIIVLNRMLNSLKCEYYIKIAERRPDQKKYIFGWIKNRVNFKED